MERQREMNKKVNPKEQLLSICKHFLSTSDGKYNHYELETRFGTKGIKYLTKLDYDNVIKKLKSLGFTSELSSGENSLKIQYEMINIKTGQFTDSNIRIEVNGLPSIQEYCKTNDLVQMIQSTSPRYNIELTKKSWVFVENQSIRSADFDDFNFRVSLSNEESISKNSKIAQEIYDQWNKSKKSFRYMNRVSFTKEGLPFRVDLSIVRSSSRDNKLKRIIKTYNIEESNVFQNPEIYEIEIETLNQPARLLYRNPADLNKGLETITKYVLSGLQCTNYPISYKEQQLVLQHYMKILHKEDYNPEKRVYPTHFVGPSSKTLQIKNIVPVKEDTNIPNIRNQYCVTDKADGDRHLLLIGPTGKIYLINTNMTVIFTGAITYNAECFNTIIDGELILHNKNGTFINLYAAFDIYYINTNDVRAFSFMPTTPVEDMTKYRLPLLRKIIKGLQPNSVVGEKGSNKKGENSSPISITTKNFYPIYSDLNNKNSMSIFGACNYLLNKIKEGLYEYETDGLIFTPIIMGVGADRAGKAGPAKKITWEYSCKWKPSEFNTVDFLITTKKGPNGDDIITPIFENGLDTTTNVQYAQYKTLVLRCGYDEKKDGYINPCQDIIDDHLPQYKEEDEKEDNYRPVQFFPSNPYDPSAGLCNILLKYDKNGHYQMFTEENEVFADNTIVEFKYDLSKEGLWRWVPLRVRYDKTAEYRQGLNNYGNSYKVANDNWYSIHNPITKEMICTGVNIPAEEDVYYNNITNTDDTKGLRDFHNLFVKKSLIQSVSKKGDILIDFACGKGGDLPKWISSNLSFVFGIDVSRDNLENRINGACVRFLKYKKDFKQMPYALFVNGNSSLNIRNGEAMLNDKAIQITKAVFGMGIKDSKLGNGVLRQYGKGQEGFHVSSCQFAIHYMFENNTTFHHFLRNVAECTKLGGYFIGTTYDGKTVFNKLKRKEQGESIEIYEDGKKIWQMTKDYNARELEDEESSLGYKISVYQESINQTIPEYLVNFDYLNRIMEDYGFVIISREDAKQIGLPSSGSGMFIELYNKMMDEINKFPNKKNEYGKAYTMKPYEKEISFLNRYFVYKKIRTVNAEKVANSFIAKLPVEIEFERVENVKSKQYIVEENQENKEKSRVKKLDKKIQLIAATEAFESEPVEEVSVPIIKKIRKPRTKKVVVPVTEVEPVTEEISTHLVNPKKRATKTKKLVDFVIEE